MELLRRFLKTAPYERFIQGMKRGLEGRGIKASVFKNRWLHQYVEQ